MTPAPATLLPPGPLRFPLPEIVEFVDEFEKKSYPHRGKIAGIDRNLHLSLIHI